MAAPSSGSGRSLSSGETAGPAEWLPLLNVGRSRCVCSTTRILEHDAPVATPILAPLDRPPPPRRREASSRRSALPRKPSSSRPARSRSRAGTSPGAFSPDGREFLFFRKVDRRREDYRIFVSRNVDGEWAEPERSFWGGEYSELYPSISPDGGRMVFTSYRPVPATRPITRTPICGTRAPCRRRLGDAGLHGGREHASQLRITTRAVRQTGAIGDGSTTPGLFDERPLRDTLGRNQVRAAEPDPCSTPGPDWRDDVNVGNATISDATAFSRSST